MGLVWARGNRKQIAQRLVLLCLGMLLLATLSGCGGHPQTIPTTVTTQQVTSQSSLAVTLTVN